MHFQIRKNVSIRTPRNQHGFFPASKCSFGAGHRCCVQLVDSFRDDLKRSEGLQPAGPGTQALRRGATLCYACLVRRLVGVWRARAARKFCATFFARFSHAARGLRVYFCRE